MAMNSIYFLLICQLCVQRFDNELKVANAKSIIKKFDVNDDPTVNINNENTTPIIGVLTQEISKLIANKFPEENYNSYIAASYVKFIESSGGRVVPIWIGQPREYYEDIMKKINGVLLPGGSTYFNQSNGYHDAGRHIYNIAIEMNDNGIHFPLWGTCLGFELLVYLSANSIEPRTYCSSRAQALPLEFQEGYEKSRLFANASADIIHILKTYPVTANFHLYCFTQETFAAMKLNEIWRVMSLNHDWDGLEFISTTEHLRYPFYGIQFHPEKNLFEFVKNRNITHTSLAIRTSQYFGNFMVNEARHNHQYFANRTEEANKLIYNYNPINTGILGSSFQQQYLFNDKHYATNTVNRINKNVIIFSITCIYATLNLS
uniref:folate gamma-glutamyl hydrolase n=1 Tax=Glossina brevipalpis TaxID=37001 RepID=A0A1A9X0N4_9MUSC